MFVLGFPQHLSSRDAYRALSTSQNNSPLWQTGEQVPPGSFSLKACHRKPARLAVILWARIRRNAILDDLMSRAGRLNLGRVS